MKGSVSRADTARGVVRWQVWAGLLLLLATLTAEWWLPTDGDVYRLPVTYYDQEDP